MHQSPQTNDDQLLLSEIFVSVSTTSTMTRSQREGLKQLLLESRLNLEESASVDRILRAVRRGTITVI